MTDLLARAVANNAAWCALVTPAGGVADPTTGVWTTAGPPPALFPDAVTLRPGVAADAVAAALADRGVCAVKDSFADVDLGAHGFELLFDATWIALDPVVGRPDPDWTSVEDPADLRAWWAAAGLPGAVPDALPDPAVRVLRDGPGRAGAIATRSDGVAGLTNVFGPRVWDDVAAVVGGCFPGSPLVGYEHGPDLDAAVSAGFRPVGPLRVWRRG